jgi:hypothetical protein
MSPRLKSLRAFAVAAVAALALGAAIDVATVVQPHQAADAAAMSNYLQNKFVDWFLRGQTFTPPATVYVALDTTAGSASACGTEVSTTSTGYARVAVTSSLANWAGTQGAGTTTASTGTSGQTSNNVAITFGAPTASWGTIVGFCVLDASSGGNLLFFAPLTVSKTVNNGDAAPSFAVGALTYTISQLVDPAGLFRLTAANDELFSPVRQAAGY